MNMKALGITTWTLGAIIIGALVNSWAMSTLWRWFVAVQYGHGPSMGAWFGLAAIARLVTTQTRVRDPDRDADWSEIVKAQVSWWLLVLVMVGTAWLVGIVTGWMS
jgi:hypothetical protein